MHRFYHWLIAVWMVLCGHDAFADYIQVPGVIHMDSSVSGGAYSFGELAVCAETAGAAVAFVTDHDTQTVTVGAPPFRSLARVTHRRPSVGTYGAGRYLADIERIDAAYPAVAFLPGIEAAPFYAWDFNDGSPMIRHYHRHMLVLGLDQPSQIEHIPSIETGFGRTLTTHSIIPLVWLIPLLWAIALFPSRRTPGRRGRRTLRKWTHCAIIAVSALFLLDGWPYTDALIDQYHGDAGAEPYQQLIDYVNAQGGLIFWAHPEAGYDETVGIAGNGPLAAAAGFVGMDSVIVRTEPYPALLNETRDYTGFAIFHEGWQHVGGPGGMWDSLLKQFCRGTRARPVWAIAELELESRGGPDAASETQTVALATDSSPAAYIDALSAGRIYCFTGHYVNTLRIGTYELSGDGHRAIAGQVLPCDTSPQLSLDVTVLRDTEDIEVVIICDGEIIGREYINGAAHMVFPLPPGDGAMRYVRVAMYDRDGMKVALNPIFWTGGDVP